MVGLSMLIVPIVLSAVIVFVVSALVWMVLPHHKTDWRALPNEEAVRSALNAQKARPGMYMIPAGMMGGQGMKDPAVIKKFQDGPVGFVTLRQPGSMSMAPMMAQSVVFYLVVSTIVAYVAGRTLAAGTDYLHVFRVTGTVAWLAYGFGGIPDSIWFGRPWGVSLKQVADALLMALVTAGTFGWLWPK